MTGAIARGLAAGQACRAKITLQDFALQQFEACLENARGADLAAIPGGPAAARDAFDVGLYGLALAPEEASLDAMESSAQSWARFRPDIDRLSAAAAAHRAAFASAQARLRLTGPDLARAGVPPIPRLE